MNIKLSSDSFSQILLRLESGGFRVKSDQISVTIRNVVNGYLTANIYVDTWPDFTAIVCQILCPNINKLLIWHAISSEGLEVVLKQSQLLPEGTRPLIFGADISLCNGVKQLCGRNNETIHVAVFPMEAKEKLHQFKCPKGYFVGKLSPEHASYVMHYWSHQQSSPDKIEFGKQCIEKLHSVAIYKDDDLSTPVSWTLQFPFFTISHVYTVKDHRKKHLAECAVARMCEVLLDNQNVPIAAMVLDNYPSVSLFRKLGFIINDEIKLCVTDL